MKLVLISDTHGLQKNLKLPEGDILVHAGDLTMSGTVTELKPVAEWFHEQTKKFEFIVTIAGNHDFCFENKQKDEARDILLQSGVIYLEDGVVNLRGLKFYGSPWQPWFYDWAFNMERGERIKKIWNKIPEGTDVLITHGPAFGILDKVTGFSPGLTELGHAGCKDLLARINEIQPKVHVSGHLHQGYGEEKWTKTHFFNASVVNEKYKVVNEPFVIELERRI